MLFCAILKFAFSKKKKKKITKNKDDDDEVSEITGGASELKTNLSTRHITPQICLDSGATSRTISRMSTSSQVIKAHLLSVNDV